MLSLRASAQAFRGNPPDRGEMYRETAISGFHSFRPPPAIKSPFTAVRGVFYSETLSLRRSARVIPSKNSSIIRSSLSHMGLAWQHSVLEQAAAPWVVQDTALKEPSVSFRMLPTVYSSGLRFKR